MSSRIEDLKQQWEGLARTDPLWAICTDPSKRQGRWSLPEFLATGEQEIETVFGRLGQLGLSPDFRGSVLDFGCGVGRLTQALARRFMEARGVDISTSMVEQARTLNRHPDTCRYIVNGTENLSVFPDSGFAFVYSSIVLQHMPSRMAISYLREFLRVLKPGGLLVFQAPDRHKVRSLSQGLALCRGKLAVRTRVRKLLGRLGVGEPHFAMELHCLSEDRIRALMAHGGGRLLDTAFTNSNRSDFNGNLCYLPQEPPEGVVSKQYCVLKEASR